MDHFRSMCAQSSVRMRSEVAPDGSSWAYMASAQSETIVASLASSGGREGVAGSR
ncbi:MAG TPA: hypothetical protein VF043_14055 [Ktedonobacteraceae bacterium]